MLEIYLPIAELAVFVPLLIGLGVIAGILSGLFGIGGGFLSTPVLIFIGVPPTVAVASAASQIMGASLSGFMAYFRRGAVDIQLGLAMLLGGLLGGMVGVRIFAWLSFLGQIDLVINLSYVVLLSSISFLMLREQWQLRHGKDPDETAQPLIHYGRFEKYFDRLPFKRIFQKSNIEVSVLVPLLVGFIAGVLVSLLGIGGGFVLIPAMLYVLGMPSGLVVGTSLFQIIFVTANATMLHAVKTGSVDVMLGMILLIGAVVGAQLGSRFGQVVKAEKLRFLLALIMVAVVVRLIFGLVMTPASFFEISYG